MLSVWIVLFCQYSCKQKEQRNILSKNILISKLMPSGGCPFKDNCLIHEILKAEIIIPRWFYCPLEMPFDLNIISQKSDQNVLNFS